MNMWARDKNCGTKFFQIFTCSLVIVILTNVRSRLHAVCILENIHPIVIHYFFLHSPTLNSWSELTEQSWPGYLLATLEVPHKLCQQIQLMNAL